MTLPASFAVPIARGGRASARPRRRAAARRDRRPGAVQGRRHRRQGDLHRPRAEPARRQGDRARRQGAGRRPPSPTCPSSCARRRPSTRSRSTPRPARATLASRAPVLKQRGIPFSERQASPTRTSRRSSRLSGGREAPTLTVGAQVLRGYATDPWAQYLDAAGYPRDSRLPSTYQYRPRRRRRAPRRHRRAQGEAAAPARQRCLARPAPTSPAPSGGIRF